MPHNVSLLTMSVIEASDFGRLGRIAYFKLHNDNDIKIIIQGKNSQTGIGKSTLAIEMCREIDQNGWVAREKAFVDVQQYLNAYLDVESQSALLLDEIGTEADSRRATSKENVELSQGWQMMRARQVATIATLPSTNTLDPRMLELADFWVLVKRRGIAQPFEINVNDFNGKISRKEFPGKEHIFFKDLPDSDPDKTYLDQIKDEKIRSEGPKTIRIEKHREKLEKAKEKRGKEVRNELIRELYGSNHLNLSYSDIGEVVGLTKQAVGAIVREEN